VAFFVHVFRVCAWRSEAGRGENKMAEPHEGPAISILSFLTVRANAAFRFLTLYP